MLTDIMFDKEKIEETSEYAKAIANPLRLGIIKMLAERNECITEDITEELPIKRTTVIQHLQELKRCGIIKGNISGKKLYYCLDYEKLRYIKELLGEALSLAEPDFVCDSAISPESILPRKAGKTHQD